MKELKKQFVMRLDELLTILALQLFLFLFGEVMVAVAVNVLKEDTLVEVGTLLALLGVLIVMVFTGMCVMESCFNLGISMCGVRKRLVPAMFFVTFVEIFVSTWTAYLFHRLELWIFRIFYSEMKNGMNFEFLFQWKYILPACVAFTAVYALLGAMFIRYGKTAFWVCWAIWVLGCIGPSRSGKLLERYRHTAVVRAVCSVWDAFGQITERTILVSITGASILILLISYFLLRRQQVHL